ncbi:MAG: hypothetical protein JWL77_6765 [Chthonomonadaceae bacterium]|nr:hypothetical protein [Chthonomonadaceae bacterium]
MVWSEPITRIAKTYGLSDVGFAKLCERHDIPRPPRGYWAQRQHGHEPEQIPLPNPKDDPEIPMRERVPLSELEAQSSASGEATPTVEVPKIVVAESLRGCHDLVSRANQELEKTATDSDGLIVAVEGRALDIRTSEGCVRRSLLLFDALLKECERRGYEVAAGPSITIQKHRMTLSISEGVETKREEAGDAADDLRGSYSFGHSRYTSKRLLTGRLILTIEGGRGNWASGSRSTWRDTEKSRLEDRLGKVLLALIDLAEMARRHEEEQERQREAERQAEARRQEAARQLAERRKVYKAEKARFTQLLQQAENLRKSRAIRELIEAVRNQQQDAQPHPMVPDGDTAGWIEWATRHADRLDPLRPSPPSILDEKLDDEEQSNAGRPHWDSSSPSPSYWEQRNWWNRNR